MVVLKYDANTTFQFLPRFFGTADSFGNFDCDNIYKNEQ